MRFLNKLAMPILVGLLLVAGGAGIASATASGQDNGHGSSTVQAGFRYYNF